MAEGGDFEEEDDIFEKAAAYMPKIVGKVEENDLLYLYARFKQATIGPCNASKPGIFDFQGRKKWKAWKELGDMTDYRAKTEYVLKMRDCDPDWDSEEAEKSSGMGPAVSRFVFTEDDESEFDPDEDILFEICKNGDFEKLTEIERDNYNSICDESQRTLLHWACDRGHYDIVEYLVEKNCDVNVRDVDLLTPLHYASLCGYKNIVEFLLQSGADPNVADDDGDTPIQCAESAEIKNLLVAAAAGAIC